MILPFQQISGRWQVIVNWQPGMRAGKRLDLRPLTRRETRWLLPELENAVMDTWARMFRDDDAIRSGAVLPDNEDEETP